MYAATLSSTMAVQSFPDLIRSRMSVDEMLGTSLIRTLIVVFLRFE